MSRLRIGFAIAGFAVALLSVTLEDVRLTWAAIALLVCAAILRLIQRKQGASGSES